MPSPTPSPALLVIDMQNGFCHPSGTFAKMGLDTSYHRAIILAIQHLRTVAHQSYVPVIYTRISFASDFSDSGLIGSTMPILKDLQGFVRNTWDADIISELTPEDGDIVIDKTRNTAFWQTELDAVLKEKSVDQLIVTGVGTNVCVESTVRDAFTQGWPVIVVSDATATLSLEEHDASLKSMRWFGEVKSVGDVEGIMTRPGAG